MISLAVFSQFSGKFSSLNSKTAGILSRIIVDFGAIVSELFVIIILNFAKSPILSDVLSTDFFISKVGVLKFVLTKFDSTE